MSDPEVDSARTVISIVAGAAAVIAVFLVLLFVGYHREKRILEELREHKSSLAQLQRDLEDKQGNLAKYDTIKDLMKPYKKHLLQSAFDLQSRLQNQIEKNFLNTFKLRGERDRKYGINSTMYFCAEFMAWMEIIRHKIVFVTGSEYAEALNALLDSIRFQLTGETNIQGHCTNEGERLTLTENNDTYDVRSHIMQLYIVDIRSIGNAMLDKSMEAGKLMELPIPIDEFLRRMEPGNKQHEAFQNILAPLKQHITDLADLGKDSAPVRRLAILQVLLCKLIHILDNALPWDFGPKFDSHEEPLYIQRDMRLTPMVKYLSRDQRTYLQNAIFFHDDPNLSFPGFREDLASQTQASRDMKLWPGACPPVEPRVRPPEYKKKNPFSQGDSPTLRRRAAGLMSGLHDRGRWLTGSNAHPRTAAAAAPPPLQWPTMHNLQAVAQAATSLHAAHRPPHTTTAAKANNAHASSTIMGNSSPTFDAMHSNDSEEPGWQASWDHAALTLLTSPHHTLSSLPPSNISHH